MDKVKIGVLTVSDRASRGEYDDISGHEIKRVMQSYLKNDLEFDYRVIPDDKPSIEESLVSLVDEAQCPLVLTTGGTGPAKRDVTPEATEAVCDRIMPGFGELMRIESLKYVPTAILSRQTAGLRGSSLIINLPGKPKAIEQCLQAVFPAIPYCIDLMDGPYMENDRQVIEAFRPKSK